MVHHTPRSVDLGLVIHHLDMNGSHHAGNANYAIESYPHALFLSDIRTIELSFGVISPSYSTVSVCARKWILS